VGILEAGVAGVIAVLLHQASDKPDKDLDRTLTPELEELCVRAPFDSGQLHLDKTKQTNKQNNYKHICRAIVLPPVQVESDT